MKKNKGCIPIGFRVGFPGRNESEKLYCKVISAGTEIATLQMIGKYILTNKAIGTRLTLSGETKEGAYGPVDFKIISVGKVFKIRYLGES